MAYDGRLKFDTKIDKKGFNKGVSQLGKLGKSTMRGIASATKVVGTAIVGVGIAAAKVGADFEQGMSQVEAVSGATKSEMEDLKATAKKLGRTTVFSATEAAGGMEYLAMAGFEAGEIIDALPGVLDAAAAGNVELGQAADITTNVLSGFSMEAENSGHVADVLTKTLTSSKTTMESLGESMKYVAPIAQAAGFSLEEMAAATGVLGDAGIEGGQAGTILRNTILRLTDPPKQAAEALDQLGISVTDASGEMKPFPEIIGELDKATQGMTKAQKTAVISQIAGQRSAGGLLAIMEGGEETLQDFTTELENAGGTAEEVAAKQLDNLKGDVILLKSALEGVGVAINENFDEALRNSTQGLTEYISQIASVIEEVDDFEQAMTEVSTILGEMFVEAIQGLANMIPQVLEVATQFMMTFLQGIQEQKEPLIDSFIQIIESIFELYSEILPQVLETGMELMIQLGLGIIEALPELMETFQEMITSMFEIFEELYPEMIEVGFEIITSLLLGIIEMMPELIEMATNLLITIAETIIENLPMLIESGLQIIMALGNSIIESLPILLEATLEIILAIAEGLINNIEQLVEAAITIIDSIAEFMLEDLPTIIDAALEIILAIMDGLLENIDLIIEATFQIIDALITAIIQSLPEILSMGLDIIFSLADGVLNNMPAIISAIISIISEIIGTIVGMLPQLLSMGIQLVGELAGGIGQSVNTIIVAAKSIARSAISGIKSIFSGIGTIGKDLVKGLWNGISDMTGWIVDKVKGFGDSVVGGLKSFFNIQSPSKLLADEIGEPLTLGIGVGMEDEMPGLEKDMVDNMEGLTDKMSGTVEMETQHTSLGLAGNQRSSNINTTENNTDNSDKRVQITGNEFIIREEADIDKVARKLDHLRKRRERR